MWYHIGTYLYYGYTTDPDLQTWTFTEEIDLDEYYYPFVKKHPTNGKYYLTTSNHQTEATGLYLFESTDKRTWTICNGGDPIITGLTVVTNSSIYFNGDTVYIVVENGDPRILGIASSNLVDLDFSNFAQIITANYPCTPQLLYLANKQVYLLFMSQFSGDEMQTTLWYAKAKNNILLADSWVKTRFSFANADVHTADNHFVELNSYFNQKTLLSYNYDQYDTNGIGFQPNCLRQAFCGLTLEQLYMELTDDY